MESRSLKINQYLMRKLLTEEERRVCLELCNGLSNDEIGKKVDKSSKTVKFHITNFLKKLEVKSRLEAVVKIYIEAFE